MFFCLAVVTFFYLVYLLLEFILGFRQIQNLSDQSVLTSTSFPTLSLILSVLNEEDNIEKVLTSFANLTYPNIEIIVVNDRSTDTTPIILERLRVKYPQLKVLHIDELPAGWFGKSHALHVASKEARGEWLLFTDADVIMNSNTLLKAMSYVLERKIDHLTVHEFLYRKDFWFQASLLSQYVYYCLEMKPWRARYSWSKKSLGRGAFNLVKRECYEQSGGHQAIAMECLDDIKLGKLLKENGCKQDVVEAQDLVEFEWYSSLQELVAGLEKNAFAFRNYRCLVTLRDLFFALVLFIWPIVSLFFLSGKAEILNVINVTITFSICVFIGSQYRIPKRYSLFYPFGMIIMLYAVWNSMVVTYRNKGVIWRGTHYPLDKLRNKS